MDDDQERAPATAGGNEDAGTPGGRGNAAMGHGVKQRDLIVMSPEEVDAFIHERRPMTMCTLNHDGSIHAVAMWYGFVDGSVAIETKAKSQKALNLRRDPRITLWLRFCTAWLSTSVLINKYRVWLAERPISRPIAAYPQTASGTSSVFASA